jgi:hypothetical protein
MWRYILRLFGEWRFKGLLLASLGAMQGTPATFNASERKAASGIRLLVSANSEAAATGSVSMISLTIAPILVSTLIAIAQTDYCKGFDQGYFVGYRHASGKDPESVPECPAQHDKEPSDWERGFRIGSQQGIEDGRR